jgi:hypothetical protein
MMGTLATVLAKKKIRTFQDRFMAKGVGCTFYAPRPFSFEDVASSQDYE